MTFLRKFHKIILKEEAKVLKPPIKHYNILFCCQVPFCMRSRPTKISQHLLHHKYIYTKSTRYLLLDEMTHPESTKYFLAEIFWKHPPTIMKPVPYKWPPPAISINWWFFFFNSFYGSFGEKITFWGLTNKKKEKKQKNKGK